MTAQEQMKKMLDELMGTQRDGELEICTAKVNLSLLIQRLNEFYHVCLTLFSYGLF